MRRPVLLTVLLVLLASAGTAATVGVSPAYMDLGSGRPGESVMVTFYVHTADIDHPFPVRPTVSGPLLSGLFNGGVAKPDRISEEGIRSWVEFTQDEFVVTPNDPIPIPGTNNTADGKVTFRLTVPSDPEPGYHGGTIRLHPDLGAGGTGYAARIVTESVFQFGFTLPGNADREVDFGRIQAFRTGMSEARIIARVRNSSGRSPRQAT
ncbi:MAG: hypothetical protein ABEK12_00635 [Candidatus Nanohaloarchaea archaeon]